MNILNSCENCEIFRNTPFHNTSPDNISSLNITKTKVFFAKRELIFSPGSKAKGFFCIKSGLARTYMTIQDGKKKELTIKIYGPGELIGFRDSVLNTTYHHFAECLEDLDACFIPANAIIGILNNDKNLELEILKRVAQRCRDYESRMLYLGIKHKHGRLAHLLLELDSASPTSPIIELKITRRIIASLIGTTPEFVMRALSDFNTRQWIESKSRKITILNYEKLKKLAGVVI